MRYKKVTVRLMPADEAASALVQMELGTRGFEAFVDNEMGFEGYIQTSQFDDKTMEGVEPGVEGVAMEWEAEDAPDADWNEEWERESFTPIDIDGRMTIRAPGHPQTSTGAVEVLIDPRMAFGSGHHETTRMMARWLMDNDPRGASVMDMGCGTGVLGIAAKKLGAAHVSAVDIDEWSVRNAENNARLNGVEMDVRQGDATTLTEEGRHDIFLANINRNILTEGMPHFAKSIKRGGTLAVSGFLADDVEALRNSGATNGLTMEGTAAEGEWRMAWFRKN